MLPIKPVSLFPFVADEESVAKVAIVEKEEEEPEEAAAGEALENNEETTEQIIDNPVEE